MSFNLVSDFEDMVADFYGVPYAIATDSCTHAIELCMRLDKPNWVSFPTHTYISIPFLGHKLGIGWNWKQEKWEQWYNIGNTRIIDAAVFWEQGGYIPRTLMCLSFQFQKHLSIGRAGMILTDDKKAFESLSKMVYDGRHRASPWRKQNISQIGYHYYMTPESANIGINKFSSAMEKEPILYGWKDYPDLSKMEVFNEKKNRKARPVY